MVFYLFFTVFGLIGLVAALRPDLYTRFFLEKWQRDRMSLRGVRFAGWGFVGGAVFMLAMMALQDIGARPQVPMLEPALLFIFGLAWLCFGVFMVARPESALRNTQPPWTWLSRWGMRLLGVFVLGGAAWLFYLCAMRIHR